MVLRTPRFVWLLISLLVVLGLTARSISNARPTPTEAPAATEPAAATEAPIELPDIRSPTAMPIVPDLFTPTVELILPPTITATASPVPIEIITRIGRGDGKLQVFVPAGEFNMGSDRGNDNERPMHTVYLDEYWIDQTEVTNAQFALCVKAKACKEPLDLASQVNNAYKDSRYENHPVVFVDWTQAQSYCSWARKRLPTEAEWEKAARGTDGRMYPWGDDPDGTKANFCDLNCWADWKDGHYDDGYAITSSVGTYSDGASPYGALDMAGNIYEWVSDWFGPYTGEYQTDPKGPTTGTERVLRGGSWGDDLQHILTVIRSDEPPDFRRDFIGFRCTE